MSETGSQIFEATMAGLEEAFQVRHIATYAIQRCNADDEVSEVLQRSPDYDQLPVESQGRIVGVLERPAAGSRGPVSAAMRPLDDSILVAADESLTRFLPLMKDPPYYRLVLEGTTISGIVTRSDVLKLPVRLLAFALVTHLESTMMTIITARSPGRWLDYLEPNRRKHVLDKRDRLQQQRANPPLLELTDFGDKRDIIRQLCGLSNKFKDDLASIEQLRNQIAHAASYAGDEQQLGNFLRRMELARKWITELGPLCV